MASDKTSANRDRRDSGGATVATFFAIVIALCYYILIYRLFARAGTFIAVWPVVSILRWVALAFAAALAVLAWKAGRDGSKTRSRRLWWAAVLVLMFAIALFLTARYYAEGAKLACIAFIVLALLRLFWCIYDWEFTLAAVPLAAAGLALYLRISYHGIWPLLLSILALLFILAVLALVLLLRQREGKLPLRGRQVRLLTKRAKFPLLIAAAGIALVAVCVGLLLPAAGLYALIAVACVVFVYLVYYTVRLM